MFRSLKIVADFNTSHNGDAIPGYHRFLSKIWTCLSAFLEGNDISEEKMLSFLQLLI